MLDKKIEFIKSKLVHFLFTKHGAQFYYSQEGEDCILKQIFRDKHNGFYVDVGAYHPQKFSNTYLLYKKGWHGINIDPNVDTINQFKKDRPRDTNLSVGISNKSGALNYYQYEEPAFNTISKQRVTERKKKTSPYSPIKTQKVKIVSLGQVLDKYKKHFTDIDYINVDVEGLELEVLKSNNWEKYRPSVVSVEVHQFDLSRARHFKVHNYLTRKGYTLIAKTVSTSIYSSR